jgi:shikimate kinase
MSELQEQTNLRNEELSPAERFYRKHLERVSTYQKANPEKMREKCKKWNAKLKEEQPEKYQEMLEKKRKYYQEVRKPKLEAKKILQGLVDKKL